MNFSLIQSSCRSRSMIDYFEITTRITFDTLECKNFMHFFVFETTYEQVKAHFQTKEFRLKFSPIFAIFRAGFDVLLHKAEF